MTANELVARVRDAGSVPTRADLTDQKILDEANSEFFSRIVPRFRKTRGNYLLDYEDISLADLGVTYPDPGVYPIPTRAVESSIDVIKYLDADGNDQGALLDLTLKQVGAVWPNGTPFTEPSTVPKTYYLDQGSIILSPTLPTTGGTGSLRVYYPRRPGKLILDSTTTVHDAVLTTTSACAWNGAIFTFSGTVSGSGITDGSLVDVTEGFSPFRLLAKSVAIDTIVGSTVTMAAVLSATGFKDRMAVGCYLTVPNTSFVPQIPQEWHEILIDFTVAKCFAKIGDLASEKQWRLFANEKLSELISSTQPRVQDSAKKIIPRFR